MDYSGIVADVAADRVERHHIFRIIVFDGGEIAEFPLYSLFRCKKICHLNVDTPVGLAGDEIYFARTEKSDRDFESLAAKMIPDNVFHNFLDTAAHVIAAEMVTYPMI